MVLVGPDELTADQITLKDLQTGEQEQLHRSGLQERLAALIGVEGASK